jgi:hypothetical protein
MRASIWNPGLIGGVDNKNRLSGEESYKASLAFLVSKNIMDANINSLARQVIA